MQYLSLYRLPILSKEEANETARVHHASRRYCCLDDSSPEGAGANGGEDLDRGAPRLCGQAVSELLFSPGH
jgi:hypothetical protein